MHPLAPLGFYRSFIWCLHIFVSFHFCLQIPISMANDAFAAASSSSMAGSASTSYSQYYDVFINHRGPDVKDTFATPLYRSLTSSGLQVFLDKPEMQVGQEIPAQIEAAIEVASVHIAIFSPRYAESKWCLNELLSMVQSGKTIIPVFHNVKPEHLRWTGWTGTDRDGPYAKALHKHEEKQRHGINTIQQWRKALSDVANISGLELEAFNGDEYELLDKLVQKVLKIAPPQLDVAKYPTGLGEKLEAFERTVLLGKQSERRLEAKVVGIVGLGGVGKTTLAKYFFNSRRSNYNGSSFLFDVRDHATRGNLSSLQCKLISDLKNRDIKINRVEEGIEILKKNLSSFQALLILDDVDHVDQLDAFLPIKDVLDPSSLILVTTRDKSVLRSASVVDSSIYHLRGLNRPQSQQLFCSYAFSQSYPAVGFENLMDGFLEACDGLPLSLKVFGALLCGESDRSYWEEVLNGLNQLPADIQRILRISYDSLNEEEQQIFLDIACFSTGEDRDMWIRVWGGSGWKSLVGFRNLQNKCLVEVDDANKIRMHDHLKDLGRYIADTSRLMARRLWRPVKNLPDLLEQLSPASVSIIPTFESANSFQDFIFKVMFHILCCNCLMLSKHKQTEVRGIRMASQSIQRNAWGEEMLTLNGSSSDEVLEIKKLQLLEAEGDFVEGIWTWVQLPKLIWLRWNKCPCSSLPSSIPMHHLRVLEVSGRNLERLWQCESQVPLQLRELNIAAPLLEFPKSLGQLKHLEKIEAGYSYAVGVPLVSLPEEFCDLCSLKYLTLRAYNNLQVLPNSFGRLTNLQQIVLVECKSLKMLPDSFGGLTNLQSIRLTGCDSLKKLPDSLGNLTNLQSIHLYGKSLEILPYSLGNLKNLQHIFVQSKCLKILPNSFGNLINLQDIDFSECELLKMLPNSLENLKNLQHIKLAGCENLRKLPDSLGSLTNLKSIDLHLCESLDMLPHSLGNLKNLQRINLSGCPNLILLPASLGDLSKLQGINLSCCEGLKLLPESLGNLTNLDSIDLSGCESLEMLPNSLGNLTNLESIDLNRCESLEMLPNSLGNLTNLKSIDLTQCQSLKMLPNSFCNLLQLKHLHLRGCCSLTIFSETLGNISMLECLDLSRCSQMELLPPQIGSQQSLKKLNLVGTKLKELPSDVLCLRNLEFLRLGGSSLEVLPPSLGYLTSLKELWLRKCENLQCLPDSIGLLTQLTVLNISRCGIQYLPPTVMEMNNLKVLTACRCPLTELPFKRTEGDEEELLMEYTGMVQISELNLYHTDISQVIFPAGICPNHKHLKIYHCRNLVEVGALPTALIILHLRYCGALTKIEGLCGLAQLERMDITGSTNIKEEELPGLGTLISLKEPIKTHDFSFNLEEYIASLEEDEEDVQWNPFCRRY